VVGRDQFGVGEPFVVDRRLIGGGAKAFACALPEKLDLISVRRSMTVSVSCREQVDAAQDVDLPRVPIMPPERYELVELSGGHQDTLQRSQMAGGRLINSQADDLPSE
jgi:hypothetical protein